MQICASRIKTLLVCLISAFLIILPIADCLARATLTNPEECEEDIKQAEAYYKKGDFNNAIVTLIVCLSNPGLSKQQQLTAYRWLGLAYLAKDYEKDAREAISKLIELVPEYEPDPVEDPPPFTEMVRAIKKEMNIQPAEPPATQKPPKSQPPTTQPPGQLPSQQDDGGGIGKWLLLGGGALVAGGVGFLVLSGRGNGDDEILGRPPILPDLPGQ